MPSDALTRCAAYPDISAAQTGADTSRAAYDAAESLHFQRAGLDEELAACLLSFDEHPGFRPVYPDALPVLAQLKALGCRIVVMTTLPLPPAPPSFGPRGLSLVPALVAASR